MICPPTEIIELCVFQPSDDAGCRARRIVGHGTTQVSTDFSFLKTSIRISPCPILHETRIVCSVLEMQDDQTIFLFWTFGCVRHSGSGPGGSGFSFWEFNQVGPAGLRLSVVEVPDKGRRSGTLGRGKQSLKRSFLVVGEDPTVRNAGPGL